MAYALVVASENSKVNRKIRLFEKICGWLKSFVPAGVHVIYKEFDKDLFYYIITMPHPKIFHSKNKTGKRKTIKKWMAAVKKNNIEHYLPEPKLKEYMNDGWSINESCFDRSIRKNVHLLFSMEPLSKLKMQTMTITLSGAEKELIRPELAAVLKNFRMVNVIGSNDDMKDLWEEFMNETGVPVCITENFAALSRSHIWISYEETEYSFDGIKVDLCAKCIICPNINKKYLIRYAFKKKTVTALGTELMQKFDSQVLSEFFLHMIINRKNIEISEAEELLGVKISILPCESQSLCS